MDVDRKAFDDAVYEALRPILHRLEVNDGEIGIKPEGKNEFGSSEARESYAKAMMLHVAPMIRDGYSDRRNIALRLEGRAGVFPTDEAVKVDQLYGPFKELP